MKIKDYIIYFENKFFKQSVKIGSTEILLLLQWVFKMNTSILMRHSEIWVNELQYESYKIDGIVVGDSISFSNLKAAIAAELDIDVSRKEIEIRYIVEGNSCPMKLKNCNDLFSRFEQQN